ncbi:MAG: hybrid sensor histidine kinase/response regulator [Cyanobacteria bacterium P01_D01_bin.123]
MDRETQQRIMGFFIEEAREHMVVLEQGLLSLGEKMSDAETINDMFRAAHSIKGGAAMLGISSIQKTAHRLEDFFKICRERPVPVDRELETLLLKANDTLGTLLDELQTPEGLSDEAGDAAFTAVEPVFQQIETRVENLLSGGAPVATPATPAPAAAPTFQSDFTQQVPAILRQMLDLFKQGDFPHVRSQIGMLADNLHEFGERYQLGGWQELTRSCREALAHSHFDWRNLASMILTELREAGEAVAAGRGDTVAPSAELMALGNVASETVAPLSEVLSGEAPSPVSVDTGTAGLADLFAGPPAVDSETPAALVGEDLTSLFTPTDMPAAADIATPETAENWNDLGDLFSTPAATPIAESGVELSELFTEEEPEQKAETETSATVGSGLDSLLSELETMAPPAMPPTPVPAAPPVTASKASSQQGSQSTTRRSRRRKAVNNPTMRVEVKHLDTINNLVGELVVNRNSLEQIQGRLQQFLDNLLFRVRSLNDMGQKLQDRYERSLLEASLMSGRSRNPQSAAMTNGNRGDASHSTGAEFDALEMDRFTAFHTLSQDIIEQIVRIRESSADIQYVVDESELVSRQFRQVTSQVQESLNRARMVPFSQIADRLPRAVRDLSIKSGKQIDLLVEGRDTLIDKAILEELYDPMTHLVNNAIVHGVEPPEVRQERGKGPEGTITIETFYQGNETILVVSDDGGGIDAEKVREKAIAKDLVNADEAASLDREDLYDFLFHPGFSTKDQADELAGRGVGMDVVRTRLNELRGSIQVVSELGKGTTFTIRLPLTLSITKAMVCATDNTLLAFPLDGVEEMIDVMQDEIEVDEQGRSTIRWRDEYLPCKLLSELLGYDTTHRRRTEVYGSKDNDEAEDLVPIVILQSGGQRVALQLDAFLEEQEIVIKQLRAPVRKPLGIAGITVLGNGKVLPIADTIELIELAQGKVRREAGHFWMPTGVDEDLEEGPSQPTVLIVDDSITVRELLSMTFTKVGYRVEQARDGQDAWDKLRAGLPCDLIFCDVEMPRMDGLELLSRVRQDPELGYLQIAMLTSRGADRHRQMAANLGASAYFTKPYLEEELLSAAARMLQGEVLLEPRVTESV